MILKQPARPLVFFHGSGQSVGWVFTRSLHSLFMEKAAKKNKDVAVTKTAEQPVATDAANALPEVVRKPVATIRAEDCSASIWAREHLVQGKPKTFYSISLERSYKDRDGRWRYTRSFDRDSLGAVVSLCQQASESIAGMMQRDAVA